MFEGPTFWHWWALGIALGVVEIFAPSTFFIWPAVAAVLTGVLVLLTPDLAVHYHILAFAVLSVAALWGWIKFGKADKASAAPSGLNQGAGRLIGTRVTLDQRIRDGRGSIRLGDTRWAAETESGGDLIEGVRVEVTAARGSTLIIRELEPEG